MSIVEILVLVAFGVILLFIGITYYLHSLKIDGKPKKEQSKKEENKQVILDKTTEQKPVPVGIVTPKSEKKESEHIEYDLAPLKDKPSDEKKTENNKLTKQSVQTEIKNMNQNTKKIVFSDLLKPKF